jgi:hypothetical protein
MIKKMTNKMNNYPVRCLLQTQRGGTPRRCH